NTQASVQTDKILGNWSMYNKEPGTATMQKTYPNLLNDNQLYFKSGLNEVYKNTGFIFFAKSVTYYIDSFLITEKDSATCFINKKDINADFKNHITEYSGGTIKIKSILPNTFRFTTNTNAENLLILKQNNYKYWSASIDGKLTQIISSSYTFMAIKVPPGSHEITFSYSPDLAIKLGILNVTSCIIFILYVIFISQKTKRVSLS
ncbi:MAG: YfhO family protein, partial [Sphingobacteriales bacterium]